MFEDIYPEKKRTCWTCKHAQAVFFSLVCKLKNDPFAWGTTCCNDYDEREAADV